MQLRAPLRANAQLPSVALLAALILTAWGALLALPQSPMGSLLGHGGSQAQAGEPGQALSPLSVAAFAVSWTLMIFGMMLPSALPFIARFAAAGQQPWLRGPHRLGMVALFVAGYAGIWLVFGVIADLGYRGMREVLQVIAHLAGTHAGPGTLLQVTLVIAGLYQFTPAKQHSTGGSCSAERLIATQAQDGAPGPSALLLGARYGWRCLGCCWALMLLMFAGGSGGAHNIGPMLVLGAIMAAEKNTVWAARLSRSLGGFLIGIALMLAWADLLGMSLAPTHTHG